MKHIFKYSIKVNFYGILTAVVISITSCQKANEAVEREYLNPDLVTSATVEGLYTQGLQTFGTFRQPYNEYWHLIEDYMTDMLGTSGFANNGSLIEYKNDINPYGSSFDRIRPFMYMDQQFDALSESEKADYQIFMWTSRAVKDFIFYRLADVYDDVPYSEALQAFKNSYFPKFDKQGDIYKSLLSDLKGIAANLKDFQLSGSYIHSLFPKNDILNGGSIVKWKSFVNTLRLRLAMRLTNTDLALAKSTIQEVIADGSYAKDKATSVIMNDIAANFTISASAYVQQALAEWVSRGGGKIFLPQNMLKILRKQGKTDDPRLMVLFQPDKDGKYTAMPTEGVDVEPIRSQITVSDLSKTFPSLYNRTTFERNASMPYLILTSTEAHLALAEAAIRWPELGLDAASEYKMAIQQSIDLYYDINAANTNTAYPGYIVSSKPSKPSQTDIDVFLTGEVANFTSASINEKMGLIFDQRYVHYQILNPYELWSDVRRLFKELGNRVIKGPSNMPLMERFPYPSNLESLNPNFKDVKAKSNFKTPVWWTGR